MKIIDILNQDTVNISFEIFPPKTEVGKCKVMDAAKEISNLNPAFISVTYGAGGGTSQNTAEIASYIKEELEIPALAHLTCVSSTKEEVHQVILDLKHRGIENILALIGDIPQGTKFPLPNHYRYASQLVEEIKELGDFCIGAACYPEGHVENEHMVDDLKHLKLKVDQGVDFLTTQMFFENETYYKFLYRAREAGIHVPILPGIMPITSAIQMKKCIELSGTVFPRKFVAMLDRFGDKPDAMLQAGIVYATNQVVDLIANGVKNIHIYTMNKPEIAEMMIANISEIIG